MDPPQLSPLRSTVVLCNSVLCPTSIDRGSDGTISSIPDLDNPVDEQNGGSLHDPTDNPSLEATTQYGVPADENIQTQSFRDHYMSQKSDVTFYDLDFDSFCNILKNEMEPPIVECRYGEPFLLAKSRNGVLFRCQELWKIFGDSFGVSLLASNSPNLIQFVPNRCGGSPILDQLIQRLKIERVALFVTRLTSNEPHVRDFLQIARTHGYHTHIEHNMSISGYKNGHELLETIIGWAIETWSQGWSFIVILDATSVLPKELLSIIRNLRKHCDDETMDVVVCGSNHWATDRFITAGANAVLKDADGKSTEFFFQKLRERAPPERIDFYERGAPFYEFTNFFEARFSVDGLDWKTSEHYFQANKFPDHRNIYNEVRRADSPRTAFNLSRRHEEKKRHDWELLKFDTGFPIKEDVMHMGLWHKFDKNPQLRNKLLSTGKARLFEHTRNDLYWGDGLDGSGKNRLGLLLERVRLELFEQEIRTLAAAGHVTKTADVRACWYMNDLKKILTDMG
ncbi:hypothetical protein BC938DRAFT_473924 [Jimgerdemannia flammicorona]|uniref:NADAR domain-containing protein n=1 Tax=Jimgerdemannia flammicorona TaxID=994334 RepID=A0A433Q389_9FUNG|nr:hypothetical protein BC938DRAFT_473924 [Jimgerdemannia flammicorona]